MSVPKSKRQFSKMEFLNTATQLHVSMIRNVSRFPKRYTFLLANPLVQITNDILCNVKEGNSINPTNAHEVQLRRDRFLIAKAKVLSQNAFK